MKKILRDVFSNTLSIYLTSLLFSGLKVTYDIQSFVASGFLLTIGEYVVKPILSLIALPLQFLTLGLFSFVINAIILLILTQVYKNIHIVAFSFNGIVLLGIRVPAFQANLILSYLIISATIYVLAKTMHWLFQE